jgi:hypothetical protein
MSLTRLLLLSVFMGATFATQAQKVKYKDIYVWLSNKQYSTAEPFLKKYVRENDDNPNAFLFMALVFEDKALKNDVVQEGSRALANIDSSLLFLDRAFKIMTEKELKRNDEYYETFKRRDLRTGEYGVKLSDLQYFIEKKQQELRERSDKVKLVDYYFALSDSLYKRSQVLYATLQQQYPSTKSLLLRAEEPTLDQLELLADRFDSCTKAFDIFKTNLQSLGKSTYRHDLTLLDVNELRTEGADPTDLLADEISMWNYKAFAERIIKTVREEVTPVKDHIVSSDIDINRLREKMERDTISVRADVLKLSAKLQHQKLTKFDESPLPAAVVEVKLAELNYKSDINANRTLRDSADIRLKLSLAMMELQSAKVLDSLSALLTTERLDAQADDYAHFITNTYGSAVVLKSYVRGMQELAQRERTLREFEVAFRQKSLKWLVVGTDSVALYQNPGATYAHQPLAIVEEKFTSGLYFTDSVTANGYFYSITPSRKPDVAITFPVEKNVHSKATMAFSKSFIVADPAGQIFFVVTYSEIRVKEKVSVAVSKIYRSDGLAWSNNFQLESNPSAATFANGELILSSADGKNWVLDKNGKLK